MAHKLLTAFVSASLVTGCAPNSLRTASTTAVPQPAAEREGTAIRLRAGSCGSQDLTEQAVGSAILGAVVGVAADFAISALTAAIRRQREGRNATWVASGDVTGLRPDATRDSQGRLDVQSYCLTIARGVFTANQPVSGDFQFRDEPAFLLRVTLHVGVLPPAAAPAAPQQRARAAGAAPPAEAPAPTVTLTAEPYELRYAETSAPVRGSGRKNVSVVIALSPQTLQPASGAATIPDTAKATVLRLDMGRLTIGRTYDAGLLNTIGAVTNLPANVAHTTATAIVTESEDSTIALDALVSAVESNEDALSDALKATIEDAIGNSDDDD